MQPDRVRPLLSKILCVTEKGELQESHDFLHRRYTNASVSSASETEGNRAIRSLQVVTYRDTRREARRGNTKRGHRYLHNVTRGTVQACDRRFPIRDSEVGCTLTRGNPEPLSECTGQWNRNVASKVGLAPV